MELLFECLWRGVLLEMETNIKLIYLRVINRTKTKLMSLPTPLPRRSVYKAASILTSCAGLTPPTLPSQSLSLFSFHSLTPVLWRVGKKAKYAQQKQLLNVKIKKMISHTRC